ncbi:MAG: cupredoxin domain-containing protein [bacterium]|nr:cupredoxin domain-containing protein [Candidatus Jorgensenbacteria bacterium]
MKTITASIIIAVGIIVFGFLIYGGDVKSGTNPPSTNNISIVNGKQIIEINAKGGYSPRENSAQAGIATVLKVKTRGTFDCSSYLVIPSMGYRTNLPPTGEKEIEIPPQKVGSVIHASCGMGMYNFQINFN